MLQAAYVAQGFGIKLNWDMRTFTGGQAADPEEPVDTFAPTGFNYEDWIDTAVSAGAKYAIIQAKHHNGFAMWPTAYHVDGESPYSVGETTWYSVNGIDPIAVQVAYCRTVGINPGLYFSISDSTYESLSGTDETTDAASYIAMIKAQLTELLTNYGDITCIWFDGWYWDMNSGYNEIPFLDIFLHVKAIQPNCLMIENNHFHGRFWSEIEEFEIPFDGEITAGNVDYSEAVDTIRNDAHWVYDVADNWTTESLKTAAEIMAYIAYCNANNGACLLAVQPGTDGELPAAIKTVLGGVS